VISCAVIVTVCNVKRDYADSLPESRNFLLDSAATAIVSTPARFRFPLDFP